MSLPIDHIVVLMMENACFDRMIGFMGPLRPGLAGVDPAHPRTNPDPAGNLIAQAPTRTRGIDRDPRHYLPNSLAQYATATNQGFITDFVAHHPNATPAEKAEVMGWYPRGFLPALHCLAENFVVCDHWFSSMPGPTWTNRMFVHTGTSLGHTDEPTSLFNSGLHLYNERTLYDELTDNHVAWRIYFGDVPQSLALTHQWSHLGNYRRFAHFAADVARDDLPAYTFIEPTYLGPTQNDQHPPHDVMRGDKLIAEIYNTLRARPGLFARTLLLVLYDEHGGFFDHVVPPRTVPPDTHTTTFGFDLLGFRVPAILVSPLLDPGLVTTVLDHTSLLRMAANAWPGVTPLGARAAQANDPLAGLNWRSTPRTDLPEAQIADDIGAARLLPRLDGFKSSLFGFTHHLESRIAHRGRKHALMRRAHESLAGAMQQGILAADRVGAFLDHPPTPSLLARGLSALTGRQH